MVVLKEHSDFDLKLPDSASVSH